MFVQCYLHGISYKLERILGVCVFGIHISLFNERKTVKKREKNCDDTHKKNILLMVGIPAVQEFSTGPVSASYKQQL